MNKDTVIGIVGCIVLVMAMVGVFAYERANAQAAVPTASADAAHPIAGPPVNGTVKLGAADAQIATFGATRAHNVTFHLTWKATNGKDTLKLTVAPPAESGIPEGGQDAKDTGDITVTVAVPDSATIAGGWKVKVEFTAATPAPLPGGIPPPTPPPNSTDSSVAYSVTTSIT